MEDKLTNDNYCSKCGKPTAKEEHSAYAVFERSVGGGEVRQVNFSTRSDYDSVLEFAQYLNRADERYVNWVIELRHRKCD